MASTGAVTTYGELDAKSNRGAHYLRLLGLRRGDVIALMMENSPRFLEICFAAQRSGLIFTAMSSRLTAAEAKYIVNDCGAKILIVSAALAGIADELLDATPGLIRRFSVDGGLPAHYRWEHEIALMPPTPIANESAGQDMLYSSGTTGRPKGVRTQLVDEALDTPSRLMSFTTALYGFGPEITYLSPAPLYHAAPLRFCMTALRLGGTVIVMEAFDAERALAAIERYRVTHSQWVPTMFVRMLKLPEEVRKRYDVSSLKVAIHAAAPCPVKVKEEMIAWWGPVLHEYYGGTEGSGLTACNSQEWLEHKGTVGKAVMGSLRILDEKFNVLPPGSQNVGTVYFADGPQFAYHNDPEKTKGAYSPQGWSTLGDIGYMDADGYLYLTDRKAHMIISGGVNIYPQEVENLLITHPKVAEVAVIGVPHDEMGEEVKAIVQPVDMAEAGPELAAELMAFCRAGVSSVKCPRSIDFEAELPRHPTGKLYKRLLRDLYWKDRTGRLV